MPTTILNAVDGSINVATVETRLRLHYEAIRALRAQLVRAGATPMLIKELDFTIAGLARAVGEAKQLYD